SRRCVRRIGGSLGTASSGERGGDGEIPPSWRRDPNGGTGTYLWTTAGGQFDWGGRLLKGNGGARRCPQRGRQSRVECKGRRAPDCETDGSSRRESGP